MRIMLLVFQYMKSTPTPSWVWGVPFYMVSAVWSPSVLFLCPNYPHHQLHGRVATHPCARIPFLRTRLLPYVTSPFACNLGPMCLPLPCVRSAHLCYIRLRPPPAAAVCAVSRVLLCVCAPPPAAVMSTSSTLSSGTISVMGTVSTRPSSLPTQLLSSALTSLLFLS